ncbi:MAG: hypothetical protein LKE31_04030 [Bacilli bacterium]|jgi:hypothetical protein|nr:hypothetical protein [Bacilli bacterium]
MALIKCPECGEMISDQSDVCIHCGYPFKRDNERLIPVTFRRVKSFIGCIVPLHVAVDGNSLPDDDYTIRLTPGTHTVFMDGADTSCSDVIKVPENATGVTVLIKLSNYFNFFVDETRFQIVDVEVY